jgi:hypothetical protein
VPHCATLCHTVPHCATLCHTVPHCATLCHTVAQGVPHRPTVPGHQSHKKIMRCHNLADRRSNIHKQIAAAAAFLQSLIAAPAVGNTPHSEASYSHFSPSGQFYIGILNGYEFHLMPIVHCWSGRKLLMARRRAGQKPSATEERRTAGRPLNSPAAPSCNRGGEGSLNLWPQHLTMRPGRDGVVRLIGLLFQDGGKKTGKKVPGCLYICEQCRAGHRISNHSRPLGVGRPSAGRGRAATPAHRIN